MENKLSAALFRKAQISQAQPDRFTTLRSAAAALSRRNADAAVCEVLNEALGRLVMLLYETDAGGLANVDGGSGRILIPMPSGKKGHRLWGLRVSEANVLRDILYGWQEAPPTLIFYEWTRHSWFVNLDHFGTLGIAKSWLRAHQITVGLYRVTRAQRVART
jgi:hypothetical protein